MAKHEVTCGSLTWTGRTMREAKVAMAVSLDKLLKHETFAPLVLFAPAVPGEPTTVLLIRCSLDVRPSWYYEFVRPAAAGETTVPGDMHAGGSCGSWATKHEAVMHARRHLAQMAFDAGLDGLEWIAPWDEEGKAEYRQWARWQARYAAARTEGKSEDEAWLIAGNMASSVQDTEDSARLAALRRDVKACVYLEKYARTPSEVHAILNRCRACHEGEPRRCILEQDHEGDHSWGPENEFQQRELED